MRSAAGWITVACFGMFALASPVARAEASTGRLVAPVEFEIEIDGRIAGSARLPPETPVPVIITRGRARLRPSHDNQWAHTEVRPPIVGVTCPWISVRAGLIFSHPRTILDDNLSGAFRQNARIPERCPIATKPPNCSRPAVPQRGCRPDRAKSFFSSISATRLSNSPSPRTDGSGASTGFRQKPWMPRRSGRSRTDTG